MDTTSSLPRIRHWPMARPRGPVRRAPRERAMSFVPCWTGITNQPNPLDTAVQSYEGGAVVTLDFTPEAERRKAVRSTSPTTT